MDDKEKELKVDERKEIEVKEIKPQELPKLQKELEEAREKGKKLYEMESKYIEEPTLYEGLDKKLKEADRIMEQRNINMEESKKEKQEMIKKPSLIKRFWRKVTGFLKRLFGKKEPKVEKEEVKPQDMPKEREEINIAMENKRKLEEMYKPYANYPKLDGTEIQEKEINEEIQEDKLELLPNEEELYIETPQKAIQEEEHEIQMKEVDDGENA